MHRHMIKIYSVIGVWTVSVETFVIPSEFLVLQQLGCDKDYILLISYKFFLKKIVFFPSTFSFTNIMDDINRNEGSISSAGWIAIQSFCSPQSSIQIRSGICFPLLGP